MTNGESAGAAKIASPPSLVGVCCCEDDQSEVGLSLSWVPEAADSVASMGLPISELMSSLKTDKSSANCETCQNSQIRGDTSACLICFSFYIPLNERGLNMA